MLWICARERGGRLGVFTERGWRSNGAFGYLMDATQMGHRELEAPTQGSRELVFD